MERKPIIHPHTYTFTHIHTCRHTHTLSSSLARALAHSHSHTHSLLCTEIPGICGRAAGSRGVVRRTRTARRAAPGWHGGVRQGLFDVCFCTFLLPPLPLLPLLPMFFFSLLFFTTFFYISCSSFTVLAFEITDNNVSRCSSQSWTCASFCEAASLGLCCQT